VLAKTGGSTKLPAMAVVETHYKPAKIAAIPMRLHFIANTYFIGHGFTRSPADDLTTDRAETANPREKPKIVLRLNTLGCAEREVAGSVEASVWTTKLVFWVCSVAGLSCGAPVGPERVHYPISP
jgi:hypothetical protein